MNGPLQRLIVGARGAATLPVRRIEPLMHSRYALAQGRNDEATTHEELVETSAFQNDAGSRAAASAHDRPPSPPAHVASTSAQHVAAPPSAPLQSDVPFSTAVAHDHIAAPALPLTPVTVAAREHAPEQAAGKRQLEHETLVSSVPAAARNLPSAKDVTQTIRERAPSERLGARAEPHPLATFEESPPAITISIGRIDVHGAPPPASVPAPSRRTAFRPTVSLDVFLRRGGSDER